MRDSGDNIVEVPGFAIGEDEHGDGKRLAVNLLLRLVLERIVKSAADFRAPVVGFYRVDMSARLRDSFSTVRSRRFPKGVVVRPEGNDILVEMVIINYHLNGKSLTTYKGGIFGWKRLEHNLQGRLDLSDTRASHRTAAVDKENILLP